MIATEAAAEGVNLQFCALIINYDLPWNPQRVEQRIGRCHRYGQRFDVVVINFLNTRNQADQRVLQLLTEKFNLFSGVFGASDDVLGRIEGVHLQYTTVIHAREARRFDVVSGTKRPLHRAALGMVLMSTLDDDRISLLLRRYNAEYSATTKVANIAATLAEVSVARDQGYYQSGGLTTPGHGVIAMLLPSALRGQRMALGVGARLDRLQLRKREYLDRLSEAIANC